MSRAGSIFDGIVLYDGAGPRRRQGGFTLLELLLASIAAGLVMVAVYEVFAAAIRMRDNAANRNRTSALVTRATSVIRNDLQNGLISGGILAGTLIGDSNGSEGGSNFPGYLKLTTTGGKDSLASATSGTGGLLYGDVQQVEYYIIPGANGGGQAEGGDLMRVVTRDLLDGGQTEERQQQILTGVQSFQVSFYDGSQWQPSWQITGSNSAMMGSTSALTTLAANSSTGTSASSGSSAPITLPEAIRVDIQQAVPAGATQAPPPIEVLVPWTTVPFLSGTNFGVGSDTSGTTGQ